MEQGRSTSLRAGGQKLIPRDISESLGKLPPQDIAMEKAVLGAIMLEKNSLALIPNLRPQHFYYDPHKEVFNAILQLKSLNEPHDFRMVINQLRKSGHIELVGGHMYVVELTTVVSSAANIQAHARVIIENAIKRALIESASQIHHDAYEDATDVLQMLDQQIENLQFLRERETVSDGPERIKLLWEKLGITIKPERPESLIMIGEADVCTVGNISLLVGKKKSRKTLLMVKLIHLFLSNRNHLADEVVIFDTEQEEYDVWRIRDAIYRMTNQYVAVFCLRGLTPKERRDFISQTIAHWPCRLKIGVIDGIRDCMSNINDPDETTVVMGWLMKMNVETKIHFINILHLNKTDGNARGHIGSELLNKAEVTIEVRYDEPTTHSIVICESSRRKPFDNFAFTHDAHGLPEIVGIPLKEKMAQTEQVTRLQAVFEGEALKSKELIEGIKSQFGIGVGGAKKLIADMVRRGLIMKSGKDRDPRTTYKLAAQPADRPSSVQTSEPELFNSVDRVPRPSSEPERSSAAPTPPLPTEEDDLPF